MTNLNDWEIAVGKLVSRTLLLVLLILMATPFQALFIVLGDVIAALTAAAGQ